MRFGDLVSGVVLLAAAIAVYLGALGLAEMPGQEFGPALVPSLIAAGFGITGLVLIAGGARRAGGEPPLEIVVTARSPRRWLDAALALALPLAGILLWNRLGFILTTTLAAGVLIGSLRRGRWLSSFAVAALTAALIDYLFRRWLLVPLPPGPLTGYIW